MNPCIRPMEKQDLELVLAWRNHPDVRYFMFSSHEITLEEHRKWFETASKASDRHLLVFEMNGQPRGFVNLFVTTGGIADWGFYTDPQAPRGTGRMLGRQMLFYGFGQLQLHKIVGLVLSFNDKSRRFHLRLGFKQEGVLRQQFFDGERYHDVYSYGLLASEWLHNTGDVK